MDKPYSSFIGISLMAVPFLYAISIFQDVCKTTLYPFLRNEYAIIVQSKNFREVSIFICRSDFLSSTRSFLLASTVIVQVQRYGSGLWKYSATFVSSVKEKYPMLLKTIWTSLSKTKACFSMIGILLVFHSCRQKKL